MSGQLDALENMLKLGLRNADEETNLFETFRKVLLQYCCYFPLFCRRSFGAQVEQDSIYHRQRKAAIDNHYLR